MQTTLKKTRRPRRHGRLLLAIAAVLVLAGILAAVRLLQRPEEPIESVPDSTVTLFSYQDSDVLAMTITRKGEDPWTVRQNEEGLFVLDGVTLSASKTAQLQNAASILTAEQVLTSDPADYAGHLADFGLDEPEFIAFVTYHDGQAVTLRVGDTAGHTNAWRYMLIDGDDRLFAFGRGMVEELFVSEASLREVEQPVLHKARIDRITLSDGEGVRAEWTLSVPITASDAADHWNITAPFVYPADATSMKNLLSNAENLRLGTYLAPATPEYLARYGFDTPRLVIELHMAEGTIATTGMDGAVTTQDFPEGTCTFIIGGAESDMIDYVRHGDSLYRCSHFTMGVFENIDLRGTMSRYLVPVALGNLASLTIEQDGERDEFLLTRTEQVAENNELVTDADGNTLYDITVTRSGEMLAYDVFEAAYERLITATVSGVLPEDPPENDPHTVFTFADVDGSTHTVALSDFDALHDTVSIDGHKAFYLIKGGFTLNLE